MSSLQSVARHAAGLIGRQSRLVRGLRPYYESLLDWQGGGHGILWEINGEIYRIDPRHRHRLGHDYDAPVAAFLRKRVVPGALCIDVGANVGVYVLQFARWSGSTAQVVAFEPNPAARVILEKHIQINALTKQVTVEPVAVGASAGEAVLFAAGADGMSRLGAPNKEIADRVSPLTVPVMTLDAYCQSRNLKPDWLFIDIEGFEIGALAGARQLIKSRGRELGLIVEMHPDVWDTAGTTRTGAEELLVELSLNVIPLTGQKDGLAEHGLVYLEPGD